MLRVEVTSPPQGGAMTVRTSQVVWLVLTNGLWPFVIISIIIINVCISVHVVQCQTCDCIHSCTDLATVEMTARNHSVQPTQGMAGA